MPEIEGQTLGQLTGSFQEVFLLNMVYSGPSGLAAPSSRPNDARLPPGPKGKSASYSILLQPIMVI
jgi:hypothetical protein